MNIDQYKASMDEVLVKEIKINDLLNNYTRIKNTRKIIYHKLIPAFLVLFLAVSCIFIFPGFLNQDSDISITAYASEQEALLSKDFIQFNLSADILDGGSFTDDKGNRFHSYIKLSLNFLCEGKDIETLTYTCSDTEITKENRMSAPAYYIENVTIPMSELDYHLENDKTLLFAQFYKGDPTALLTKMIGNSYTVNYEEQQKPPYGLYVAADVDGNNNYRIKDIIIKLDITMKDGSVQHKRILIEAAKNAFLGIKVRLL